MGQKISVMVADDSALMRRMISDMINMESDMEVIEIARNGEDLLEKLKTLEPDVITLDVEMPKMSGIEALKKIVEMKLPSKVIMLSSLTKDGADTTMECLELGAIDFVPKPSGSISLDINAVKEILISKIKSASKSRNMMSRSINKRTSINSTIDSKAKEAISTLKSKDVTANHDEKMPLANRNSISKKIVSSGKISAVVIGASTGGPKALYEVITKLPGNLNVPVLVVQHMPEGFTKAFADRLNRFSNLSVVEASEGMNVEKGVVYIAPGGKHMTVIDKKIRLNLEPSIWGVRPAVDKLFVSAVKEYRNNLLGVILTGMGRDGADGIVAIKQAGGYTISEDESTCVIYGMPRAAFETNMVDEVIPLYDVSKRISNIVLGEGRN